MAIVRTLTRFAQGLWVALVCAVVSVVGVGFVSAIGAWYASNPGCECLAQKLDGARLLWEKHKIALHAVALFVFVANAFLLYTTLVRPAVLRSVSVGLAVAAATWMWFTGSVEPNLNSPYYLRLPLSSIVSVSYDFRGTHILEQMLTWKFIVALSFFALASLSSWLLWGPKSSRRLNARYQNPSPTEARPRGK